MIYKSSLKELYLLLRHGTNFEELQGDSVEKKKIEFAPVNCNFEIKKIHFIRVML